MGSAGVSVWQGDVDFLEVNDLVDQFRRGDPGCGLEVPADCAGCGDDGEVGCGWRLWCGGEDEAGFEVVFTHAEGLFDVPQLVVVSNNLSEPPRVWWRV